ncbi:hypothetical protein X943_001791 [Babesia divergens]|uniref:Uncharacterized protein n=1 Tax=Babesia divergens TaxID=32595 RepID=A0AAD9GD62_BABDI|nr:hypothetical protein X943_001791 [Babesia divergens]
MDRDPAKEPVAPVVAIEDSHEPECGGEELVAVKDTSVIAECLPRIPVETIDDSLASIPDPPEVQQQHVETTAPLVTEDIYDPFIMSLSPRIGSRWGSTDDDKSRHASVNTNGLATDTSTGTAAAGETLDQNFFLYGVTLLRDRKKQTSAGVSATTPDEHISTDISLQDVQSSISSPLVSVRSSQLVSHRIPDDWSNLNPRVYDSLLQYFTGSELSSSGQQIGKQWSDNVKVLMNNKKSKIITAFKATYEGQLEYQTSYLICQPVFTAQKGMRIDLILRARATSWSSNARNSLQYTYTYIPRNDGSEASGREPIYANKFVFECLKRNSNRTVSYTRDVSSVHGDDLNVATTESISQICEGDSIELPVVLMNALGNINVESINFLPICRMPSEGKVASALDNMHREWYTVGPNSRYLRQLFPEDIDAYSLIQPEKMQPHLTHKLTQVAGIDVITTRSIFVASTTGEVAEARKFIGHTMEVVDKRQPIVCMLQRTGIQYDRLCHVQLRVGDNVRFYTTKG